jgi:hypothetical protein
MWLLLEKGQVSMFGDLHARAETGDMVLLVQRGRSNLIRLRHFAESTLRQSELVERSPTLRSLVLPYEWRY